MVIKEIMGMPAKVKVSLKNMPRHVALTVQGSKEYAEKHRMPIKDVYKKNFENIKGIVNACVKLNIPVITFSIMPTEYMEEQSFPFAIEALIEFFTDLLNWDVIQQNQIKVSVLGKWYDLPHRVVEPIKKVLEDTKDYDKFFFNLCINYDGQEEIVDAFRLLARQVKSDKLDPDSITKSVIKENIYTSYFLPPDIIVRTGKKHQLGGILLWDSPTAKVYFAEKLWADFDKMEFIKAVQFYQND